MPQTAVSPLVGNRLRPLERGEQPVLNPCHRPGTLLVGFTNCRLHLNFHNLMKQVMRNNESK